MMAKYARIGANGGVQTGNFHPVRTPIGFVFKTKEKKSGSISPEYNMLYLF